MEKASKTMRVLTPEEQKERASIIRECCPDYTKDDFENYADFTGMDAKTARKLIDLGYADPNDRQNEAPTLGEFVSFCEKYPEFRMNGYTIGGDRDDARISIPEARGTAMSDGAVQDFISLFRGADEFSADAESGECYCWFD